MPRADEPRLTIRFSREEFELVDRSARVAGVGTAAMVREAAVLFSPVVAADRAGARVAGREVSRLRRRRSAP